MSIIPLSGCAINNEVKEGDLVTWQITPKFIVKTELGLQQELIAHTIDSPLYNDPYEKYVGVFPLDYKPVKHEQLSIEESNIINKSKNSQYKGYTLSFDLALNDSKFQPNDFIITNDKVMVHDDQIRVEVNNNVDGRIKIISEDEVKSGKYNESLSKTTSLECYFFEKVIGSEKKPVIYTYNQCIGKPKNNSIPNVNIQLINIYSDYVIANYYSEELDVNVSWRINKKYFSDWEKIHSSIWNLINSWNVAPNI